MFCQQLPKYHLLQLCHLSPALLHSSMQTKAFQTSFSIRCLCSACCSACILHMSSVDLSTLPSSCKYAHDVPYADAKTVTNPDKETEVQGRTQNQGISVLGSTTHTRGADAFTTGSGLPTMSASAGYFVLNQDFWLHNVAACRHLPCIVMHRAGIGKVYPIVLYLCHLSTLCQLLLLGLQLLS